MTTSGGLTMDNVCLCEAPRIRAKFRRTWECTICGKPEQSTANPDAALSHPRPEQVEDEAARELADLKREWPIARPVEEFIRKLLARPAPKPAGHVPTGWRTMDSAPKDGTEILLYGRGVLGSGSRYGKGRHVGWAQISRNGSLYWATRDPEVTCKAEAWRPLPEPPEAA